MRSSQWVAFRVIAYLQLTVRQELERDDVDQTLETVNGLRNTDDLGPIRNSVVVLAADDDCQSDQLELPRLQSYGNLLGRPLRAVTWARADCTLGYSESLVMMKMTLKRRCKLESLAYIPSNLREVLVD